MSALPMPEPIAKDANGFPVFDGAIMPAGRLMLFLLTEDPRLPLPCWIQCGRTRTMIPPEDRNAIGRGIMLAIEMRDAEKGGAE